MGHYLIATMMLVAGLFTVVSWEATFPDRRDILVLAPLPVTTRCLFLAKLASASSLLALAVVTLNCASGLMFPALSASGLVGFLRCLFSFWFTLLIASLFLYGAVLSVQGISSLLLPRRLFLRLSAILQIAAYGLFLGVYFLQPGLSGPELLRDPQLQWIFAYSPSYWFFALFEQLNGSLPREFSWLAWRAWIALGAAFTGALLSLLLGYRRTLRKTIEEPDLLPAARGLRWTPRIGNALHSAISYFSLRSLARSRQHRVALAFYLSVVLAVAFFALRTELAAPARQPLSVEFCIHTFFMMSLTVIGLRRVISLPIALKANWILRITQLCPSPNYVLATRQVLLLLAVVPIWILSALLSLGYQPFAQVVAHLLALAIFGFLLVDLCLFGFYKIPFTCSYLPGKANFQLVFWAFFIVFIPFLVELAEEEERALAHPLAFLFVVIVAVNLDVALLAFHRDHAQNATLYFEEQPPEIITTLGLILK
jgi:hypothetical protein